MTTPQNEGSEIDTPESSCNISTLKEYLNYQYPATVGDIRLKNEIYRLIQVERELNQSNLQIAMDTIRFREITELGIKRDIELEQSTKKFEIVDELVEALKRLHNCIDLCNGHGTPIIKDRAICYLSMMETEQALSRAENL